MISSLPVSLELASFCVPIAVVSLCYHEFYRSNHTNYSHIEIVELILKMPTRSTEIASRDNISTSFLWPHNETSLIMQICCEMFLNKTKNICADSDRDKCFIGD